jgi:hypothetical protein
VDTHGGRLGLHFTVVEQYFQNAPLANLFNLLSKQTLRPSRRRSLQLHPQYRRCLRWSGAHSRSCEESKDMHRMPPTTESKDMHRMPPTTEPLSQNALDETFV